MKFMVLFLCVFLVAASFSKENPSEFIQANEKVQYKIVGKYPRANG
jgi:hypothetical protein